MIWAGRFTNVLLERRYDGLVMAYQLIATIRNATRELIVGLVIFAEALIVNMRTGDANCISVKGILTIGSYALIAPAIASHLSQNQIILNGCSMC